MDYFILNAQLFLESFFDHVLLTWEIGLTPQVDNYGSSWWPDLAILDWLAVQWRLFLVGEGGERLSVIPSPILAILCFFIMYTYFLWHFPLKTSTFFGPIPSFGKPLLRSTSIVLTMSIFVEMCLPARSVELLPSWQSSNMIVDGKCPVNLAQSVTNFLLF